MAPALYVSIAIAIFAGITQVLTSAGVVGLDTGEMVTVWLWVAGFTVLLWIAYIIGRAYVTAHGEQTETEQERAAVLKANEQRAEALMAKANTEQELKAAQEQIARLRQDAESRRNPPGKSGPFALGRSGDGSGGEDEDAWVPPEELRYLDGSEHSVSTTQVFPARCYYLEPDAVRPVVDKFTGQQVYQCRVLDLNPELKDRRHETLVNILANQKPFPSIPRFGLVEFDDLTITTYVTDRSPMRLRYSLRATGIRLAAAPDGRVQATWTVPRPSEAVTSEIIESRG